MNDSTECDPAASTDTQIRSHVEVGDLNGAASLFLESYGGEILGFLHLCLRDETEAAEVYSAFTEDFWRGLPGFQWKTSIRSWGYTLARNAACRSRRPARRKTVPLTHPSQILENPDREHSITPRHVRTEVKERMRQLRAHLPVDDQALLVLRIDKGLSWNELAAVFSGEGDRLSIDETKRWAVRLRQRFVSVKARLRSLAEAEGIV